VVTIVDVTADQMLSLGQFLRARQADILADWKGAIRDTLPNADITGREAVTPLLLDQLISACERPSVAQFSAADVIDGNWRRTIPRSITNDLFLLRRVIVRRLRAERSGVSAEEYERLWVAFENVLADAFGSDPDEELTRQANEAPSDSDVQRTASERRDRFLGEASRILSESLDYQETLRSIARLAVPEIADLCIIDLVQEAGTLVRVATEHRDAGRAGLASQLHTNPPRQDSMSGAPYVVRTGRTEHVPRISDSLLQQREQDPERLRILRSLGVNSTICAPLAARGRLLGAITLLTELGRELTTDDVRMTENLAGRAATAIDNARLYDDAQRALRAREEILAIVTHDLRTPLSAVMTAASLLATVDAEDPDHDRIRQRAETIQRSTQHMSRLVRDLSDLAQIDAGRLAIEKQLENPGRLVCEAAETLETIVRTRGGTLRCEVGADVPAVACDRERIVQVISNLVGNASKVGASSITVRVEPRQEEVVFSVADTGPGIPAEDLPHMFDRYWRGRNAGYKGTGLGLPISNGIVKAHGGRMWIESAVGTGSTFHFSIPR
jgi:signal transduction histidine kinase